MKKKRALSYQEAEIMAKDSSSVVLPEDKHKKRKARFLRYYEKCPVAKFAAAHCGRGPGAVIKWQKEDPRFERAMERLKAKFVMDNLGEVKDKRWILSKLFFDTFGDKQNIIVDKGESFDVEELSDAEITKRRTELLKSFT